MDLSFLYSALILGLVSNLHCVGMCGPISLAIPVKQNQSRLLSILIYNLGRIFTYGAIGALFGLFGKSLVVFGIQQQFSIFIGITILISALIPVLAKSSFINFTSVYGWLAFAKQLFAKQLHKKGYVSLFVLGFFNGLLPCGMVYLAAAGSIISGSVAGGFIYMVLFGVGTIPVMFMVPYFGSLMGGTIRSKFKSAVFVFSIVFGVLLIVRGANLGLKNMSPKIQLDRTVENVDVECH